MSFFQKLFSAFNRPEPLSTPIVIEKVTNDSPIKEELIVVQEPVNPFTFDFTYDKFKKIIINKDSKEWYDVLYDVLPLYNINTPERVAGFLAQTGHESMDYTTTVENLNYSAQGLHKTFPRRFPTLASAKSFHRKPQLIANKIYSNRMGNGNPESNDGWNFRGRGLIQLTGKTNYTNFSKFIFNDLSLLNEPDLVEVNKRVCVLSACWYWQVNDINQWCDKNNIVMMTKKINGGDNGLADRKVRYNKALNILKV
jgi:putative chitinase